MLPYKPSQRTYMLMKTSLSTTTTPLYSSKHSKSSSKTTLYSLATHSGSKSWVQEWASPQPHPGLPFSTHSANNNFYQNGLKTYSSTNTSSMMLSASGYHTLAPRAIENYGICSNNECKTGMDFNGFSPNSQQLVTLWTLPSQSSMTKSLPSSTRKNRTYTYIFHHTWSTHLA